MEIIKRGNETLNKQQKSFDEDSKRISWIQFHSSFNQTDKNILIGEIEKRMRVEEQKDLDGRTTGYYE